MLHKAFALVLLTSTLALANPIKMTSAEPVKVKRTEPIIVNLGAAIAVMRDVAMPGPVLGIGTQISKTVPTYVGIELASYFNTKTSSGAVMPLLLDTHVVIDAGKTVKPTVGLAVGTAFNINVPNEGTDFAMMFRPGVNLVLANETVVNFQARFGVIGSDFVFVPQLGTAITF